MTTSRRLSLGHGLMQVGVGVRVSVGCAVGSLLVALLAGVAVLPLARGPGYPGPFALLAHDTSVVGVGTWLWQGALIVAGALALGRALAFAVGGLGWSLLPSGHRDLLSRVAAGPDVQPEPARSSGRVAGPASPPAVAGREPLLR